MASQALNGLYMGRSRKEWVHVLPDGRHFNNRQKAKVRNLESGWNYCAEQLVAFGAEMLDPDREDPRAWLARWASALCRRTRHPGNHKYAWTLHKRHRRHLPDSKPYPKLHMRTSGLLEVVPRD